MIKKIRDTKRNRQKQNKNLNVVQKLSIPLRRNFKRLIFFRSINFSPIINIKELNSNNKSSFGSGFSRENKDNKSCCFSYILRDNKRFLKVTTLIPFFILINLFFF